MPDYHQIYRDQAAEYELLVSREDYQGNIFRTLDQIVPLLGLTVVELGAGTGRLTCLLAPVVKSIYAFDRSPHMLEVAVAKLRQSGRRNWHAAVSDHREMPVRSGIADVALSGWSICYMVVDSPANWEDELVRALSEMRRVVRPGGRLLLLETLGTGVERPDPPIELLEYYEYLEARGFSRTWIRTDYRFRDRTEAEASAQFFFGDAMVGKIIEDARGVILPECTGVWWSMV